MGTVHQDDADWGEDDDDFLCAVDWCAWERHLTYRCLRVECCCRTGSSGRSKLRCFRSTVLRYICMSILVSRRDAQEERVHSGMGTNVQAEEGAAEQHRRSTVCTTGLRLSLRGVFGQLRNKKQSHCAIDLTCEGEETGGLGPAKEEVKPREHTGQGGGLLVPDEGQCAVKVTLLPPEGEAVDIPYPFMLFHVSNSRSAKVLQVFQGHPLCSWNQKKKCWKCPAKSYVQVMRQLKKINSIQIEDMANAPSSVLKATLELRDDSMRYSHIPDVLEQKLMQFQRIGVKFALRRGGRCLLGDEMGLGKTVQALAVASAYRDEWPVLVVAPSSMRESWADSIETWLQVLSKRIRVINTGKDASVIIHGSVDFLIISYNFLDKMVSTCVQKECW